MTTECYELSFLLFANAREAGHHELPNARHPGLIVHQMPGVSPGGLAVGTDSHMTIYANRLTG